MEPGAITSELVFQAAASGDPLALTLVDEVVDALAVGLTNGLHVFNPDLVVLGGGVTVGLTDLDLLPRIDQLMRRRAMSEGHRDFRLVPSKLGDRAGMAGAAALAWEAAEKG
jgi:glucokinase